MRFNIFILYFLFFSGCIGPIKEGQNRYCENFEEAKKKEVFSDEYIPSQKLVIRDSIRLEIKEVWVENQWWYKNQFRQIEKDTVKNLLISFTTNSFHYLFAKNHPSFVQSQEMLSFSKTDIGDTKYVVRMRKFDDIISIKLLDNTEIELVKMK